MADVFSRRKRSEVMAAIRSRGNRETELRLVALFRAAGITGWRRHQPLIGRPDFLFRRARVAVFVDGCFWHRCRWHCRMPRTRAAFWRTKLARNRERDREVSRQLRAAGWRVVRVWEHSLKDPDRVRARLRAALEAPAPTRSKTTANRRRKESE